MYTPEAWENHQLYITAYEWNPQVDALYLQAEAQMANLNYQLVLHKFKMIEKGKDQPCHHHLQLQQSVHLESNTWCSYYGSDLAVLVCMFHFAIPKPTTDPCYYIQRQAIHHYYWQPLFQ